MAVLELNCVEKPIYVIVELVAMEEVQADDPTVRIFIAGDSQGTSTSENPVDLRTGEPTGQGMLDDVSNPSCKKNDNSCYQQAHKQK